MLTNKDQSLNSSFTFTACKTQAKFLKLSISPSVKQGYPSLRVVGGLSEMVHVKCPAQKKEMGFFRLEPFSTL